MRFKVIYSLIFVQFAFFCITYAQEQPEDIIDTFFEKFEQNISESIDYLFSTNELIDGTQKNVSVIKERLDTSRRLLGEYYGYELIAEYRAGYSYRKYKYSLRYERQPLKMELILYKPNNVWKVQNVNFHDDIGSDFIRQE